MAVNSWGCVCTDRCVEVVEKSDYDKVAKRFTNLDKPRHSADPMLDSVMMVRNPDFEAWVASLPDTYWARYDLSAARIGWEAARRFYGGPP